MVSLKLESPLVLRIKKLVLMSDNPNSLTSTTKHVFFSGVWKASFPNSAFWVHSYRSRCPLVVRLLQQTAETFGTSWGSLTTFPGTYIPSKAPAPGDEGALASRNTWVE